MPKPKISAEEVRDVDKLVRHYSASIDRFSIFLDQLRGHIAGAKELQKYVHSMKWRVKDPEHLRDKLKRKLLENKQRGRGLGLTTSNLFRRVNDLAGFRILHLYTQQIEHINQHLLSMLDEAQYRVLEGPIARTWDDESRKFFSHIGIQTMESPTMYTSVHYVVLNNTRTPYTCEIQVRTLMEEVWGEVDHSINYPHGTTSIPCKEQIAALARVTSGCTRLVDSIFRSHVAHVNQ